MKQPQKTTVETMYTAIAEYIKEAGGTAVIVGGVSLSKKADGRKLAYTIHIDITGKLPPL